MPRRGSEEYKEVRKIMDGLKGNTPKKDGIEVKKKEKKKEETKEEKFDRLQELLKDSDLKKRDLTTLNNNIKKAKVIMDDAISKGGYMTGTRRQKLMNAYKMINNKLELVDENKKTITDLISNYIQ